jgi:hypothetical protein
MFVVGLALLYTTAVASVGDSSNNGTHAATDLCLKESGI